MFRGLRAPRWFIQRDIQALIRSFPSERITIVRPSQTISGLDVTETSTPVFVGEALIIPAGGDVRQFGIGQIEESQPQVLVAGDHDIRQGDLVTLTRMLPGGRGWETPRRYQVQYAPNVWRAFMVLTLRTFEQGY